MFIHSLSKCPTCFSNIVHFTLSAGDKVYDITNFTCYVFCNLNDCYFDASG